MCGMMCVLKFLKKLKPSKFSNGNSIFLKNYKFEKCKNLKLPKM
jgi:hypothetical protein